jgi:hypothetical protein
MKDLKTLLEGSLLDDIDNILDNGDREIIKIEIRNFIKDNYKPCNITISDKSNKDGKYEVSCKESVSISNKDIISLTNGLFIWKYVKHDFDCRFCNSLVSLEGAPETIGRSFYFGCCKKLKSLDGFPKKIGFFSKNNSTIWAVGLNKKLINIIRDREKLNQICEIPEQITIMS